MVMLVFSGILVAWIGAWMLELDLLARFEIFTQEWVTFLYWLMTKTIIWILPSIWLIKRSGRNLREIFKVVSRKKALGWGFGIGIVLLALSIGARLVNGDSLALNFLSFPFLTAVIIAPVFEELLMRGAILNTLKQKHSFLFANIVTSLLFVFLHCPGWYFTGVLRQQIFNPLGGALAICVIGFLCGLAAERGKSIHAAVIVHLMNNIF